MSSGFYNKHSSVELYLLELIPSRKNTILIMTKNLKVQVPRRTRRSAFFTFDFVINHFLHTFLISRWTIPKLFLSCSILIVVLVYKTSCKMFGHLRSQVKKNFAAYYSGELSSFCRKSRNWEIHLTPSLGTQIPLAAREILYHILLTKNKQRFSNIIPYRATVKLDTLICPALIKH